jgi:hypothetical protein
VALAEQAEEAAAAEEEVVKNKMCILKNKKI